MGDKKQKETGILETTGFGISNWFEEFGDFGTGLNAMYSQYSNTLQEIRIKRKNAIKRSRKIQYMLIFLGAMTTIISATAAFLDEQLLTLLVTAFSATSTALVSFGDTKDYTFRKEQTSNALTKLIKLHAEFVRDVELSRLAKEYDNVGGKDIKAFLQSHHDALAEVVSVFYQERIEHWANSASES